MELLASTSDTEDMYLSTFSDSETDETIKNLQNHPQKFLRPQPEDECDENSKRVRRTMRTCGVFFFLALIWHSRVLALCYNIIGKEWAARLALYSDDVNVFQESFQLAEPFMVRAFALSSTVSHTFIFWYGLQIAEVIKPYTTTEDQKFVLSIKVLLALFFQTCVLLFFRFVYNLDFWPITIFADLFFHSKIGREPFAWVSSISYTCAYFCGLCISKTHQNQFEKTLLLNSEFLIRSQLSLLATFLCWLSSFDMFLVPFLRKVLIYLSENEIKYLGLFVGILVSSVVPLILDEKRKTVYEHGSSWLVTFGVSWMLVGLVVHEEEFKTSKQSTNELTFLYYSGGMIFLLGTLFSVAVKEGLVLVFRSSQGFRSLVTYLTLFSFWMCYLVCLLGSGFPFMILSLLYKYKIITEHWKHSEHNHLLLDYTILTSWFDWFYTMCFITFAPVVFGQSLLKVYSAKAKLKWHWKHEVFSIVVAIVPSSFHIYKQYCGNSPGFPVVVFETILHVCYVGVTWPGRPEYSGHRKSKAFETLISPLLNHIAEYFNFSVLVFKSQNSSRLILDDNVSVGRMIGFHPHGVYPVSVAWQPVTKVFKDVLGTSKVHTCTDAFTMTIPGMRDLLQYLGGIEVHKQTLERALKEKKTILLVPGGQGEILLHTRSNLEKKVVKVCAKHKGFIRLALECEAELIPCFNFGELESLQNVYLPTLQNLTRKVLAFPFPFLPVGVFDCLPIPKQVKMTLVVSEPIQFVCAVPGKPSDIEVDQAHALYFSRLRELFETKKVEAGYPNHTLVLEVR